MPILQTYFENARNFTLNNVHFTNITAQDFVSTTFREEVATGAIFDSNERFPPGKCHPGTRKWVLEQITAWINDPDVTAQRILWIHGPAGSGKSALAQTICELLVQCHPAQYGGSFFFARGSTDRGKALKLFTTLAYQLALRFPSMRSEVNDALYGDPTLPTKSIEVQLFSLIVQPLLRCGTLPSPSPVLIIDGLDECADDDGETQCNIVSLISKFLVEYNLPLRFIIASRPEAWIRDIFYTPPLPDITLSHSLRDDLNADRDIKAYLTEEFEKIRVEKQRIMGSVKSPWPPTEVIDHFVYEASGQYIYASTVLKFVGKHSRFSDPQEQLRIITSPGLHRAAAFSELNRLYATVLAAYPRWETMKRVLQGLLVDINTTTIEVVLCVDHTELTLVLDGLSSLLDITQSRELSYYEELIEPIFGSLSAAGRTISFCHLSFREFLEDELRSGPFHVNVGNTEDEIIGAFFRIINNNLDKRYEIEPHVLLNIDFIAYDYMMSDMITFIAKRVRTVRLELVNDMTQRIMSNDPNAGRYMEYPGHFLRDLEYIMRLSRAFLFRLPDSPASELRELEMRYAILRLQNAVSLSKENVVDPQSWSYNQPKITPALVYISLFSATVCDGAIVDNLFSTPGISESLHDAVSTLVQHRHILILNSVFDGQSWSLRLHENLKYGHGVSQAEWRDQQTSLAYHCLKSIMNSLHNDWEHTDSDRNDLWTTNDAVIKEVVLGPVFDDFGITNRESFGNTRNMALFDLMIDSRAWTSLIPLRLEPQKELQTLIGPALCWFHRQLTDFGTISLLRHHEETLPQRMAITMKDIFYYCLIVPNFMTPSFEDSILGDLDWMERFVKIGVQSLPDPPFDWRDKSWDYTRPVDRIIFDLQDTLFNSSYHNQSFVQIERSIWYPHLATYLFHCLARCLYCRATQAELTSDHQFLESSTRKYLVECLPYAQTTQRNLDALRAVAYFSKKVTSPWRPPVHFCSLTGQFLKKYESSVLTPEELILFERWLFTLKNLEEVDRWPGGSLNLACIQSLDILLGK